MIAFVISVGHISCCINHYSFLWLFEVGSG